MVETGFHEKCHSVTSPQFHFIMSFRGTLYTASDVILFQHASIFAIGENGQSTEDRYFRRCEQKLIDV